MKIYALYALLVVAGVASYPLMRGRPWPRWVVHAGIAAVLIAFMAWASEPERILSDFKKAYYASGSLVIDDPDALYPDGRLAFTNIPIVGWLFVPIAYLPVNAAAVVWTAFGVAAVAAACWGLIAFAGLTGWRRDALVGLFLINGPLFNSLREGNLTHVVLFALVVALWLLKSRRDVLLGVLLGVCVIIKPPLALVAVPLVLRGHWRFAGSFAATVGGIAGLSLAVFGLDLHRSWYDHSVRPFSEHPLGAANVQSIDGFLARLFSHGQYLGDYTPIAEFGAGFLVLRLSLVALIVGIAAVSWWRAKLPPTPGNLRLELCTALCVSLVVGPISWSHYYALTLIPLALILGGKIPFPTGHAAIVALCIGVALISPPVFLPRVDGPVIGPLLARILLSNYFYGGMLMLALLLAARWHEAMPRPSAALARRWHAATLRRSAAST